MREGQEGQELDDDSDVLLLSGDDDDDDDDDDDNDDDDDDDYDDDDCDNDDEDAENDIVCVTIVLSVSCELCVQLSPLRLSTKPNNALYCSVLQCILLVGTGWSISEFWQELILLYWFLFMLQDKTNKQANWEIFIHKLS